MSRAEDRAADLLASGYLETTSIGRLTVGQRVHHIGERYPEASDNGTAVLERIFHQPGRAPHNTDVEVIVKRDKPRYENDTHGFWADYHTVVVTPLGDGL